MADYMWDPEQRIKLWTWKYRINTDRRYRFGYTIDDFKIKVNMDKLRYTYDKPTMSNPKTSRPTSSVVYTSNYTNNTDQPQEVNIKVKRVTSATAKAKVTNGFMSDNGVGLKLRMPNELTAQFDGNVILDADDEDVIEKKMTWTFGTKMTAPPRRKTVAKFEVNEVSSTCDFSTYVHFYGNVKIKVILKHTGDPVLDEDVSIKKILSEILPPATVCTPEKRIVRYEGDSVKCQFCGTMDFHYGISQNEVIE